MERTQPFMICMSIFSLGLMLLYLINFSDFTLTLLKVVYFGRVLGAVLCRGNQSQDRSIDSISAWNREVPSSIPGKGETFSVKISNWIVRI